MWIFDATPVIYLAKSQQFDIIESRSRRCGIPEPVKNEVVTDGIAAGYPDARVIERRITDGTISVVSVPETDAHSRLLEYPGLSCADAAVLACAEAFDGVAVMDESAGRSVATVESILTRGTAYLVLDAVKRGDISKKTARTTIDTMIEAGWYCAPDMYAKICQKLESSEFP